MRGGAAGKQPPAGHRRQLQSLVRAYTGCGSGGSPGPSGVAAAASSSGTEAEGLDRLRKLKILLDEDIITQEDYDIKKQELLKEL